MNSGLTPSQKWKQTEKIKVNFFKTIYEFWTDTISKMKQFEKIKQNVFKTIYEFCTIMKRKVCGIMNMLSDPYRGKCMTHLWPLTEFYNITDISLTNGYILCLLLNT